MNISNVIFGNVFTAAPVLMFFMFTFAKLMQGIDLFCFLRNNSLSRLDGGSKALQLKFSFLKRTCLGAAVIRTGESGNVPCVTFIHPSVPYRYVYLKKSSVFPGHLTSARFRTLGFMPVLKYFMGVEDLTQ
jgi:hypothetical protein